MPEIKELWLQILLMTSPIVFFMFYKKGRDAFSSSIAESVGKKSFGANGPHVPTWIGIAIVIITTIAILVASIYYLGTK